jgi:ribonuclease BN (tRNA processing enzyme)
MISFHILGAGGAVPTPTHNAAAYWVAVDGTGVLMDPGPGALVRLVKSGLTPAGVDDIGLVVMTHLHPDHCADLVPLLFATHSPIPTSTEDLRLFGPPGLGAYLDRLRDIYGTWLDPRLRSLVVTELLPGDTIPLPGGGSVRPFPVDHPQDRLATLAFGYRFLDKAGRAAVFSGDTGPCPALNEAARGAELLVVECSTPDDLATPGHMTVSQVAELCADARPGRVVLTHQYPPAAALDLPALIRPRFGGAVFQASDGDRFDVTDLSGEEVR